MQKPESKLQREIKEFLQKTFGGIWHKIHGDMFQDAGIGDLVGCVQGHYFNLEVKMPNNKKRKQNQTEEINRVNENGGCGSYVTSVEEAYEVVRGYLKSKALPFPKESFETLSEKQKTRSVDGPRNRKNHSHVKSDFVLMEERTGR